MTQIIDWAARGISWIVEEVSKQQGPHATDRVVIGKAQIPDVTDLSKFVAEYGESCVLGITNGTSLRVMAQDVNRSGLAKGLDADAIKARIDARLRGTRNRPLTSERIVKVTVYALPGGQTYAGESLAEYQAEYMAALVDMGTPADVSRQIALGMTPEGLK